MSTTPNQKDLLAKKSDLEGILKPDDNDVLHLPEVTITLAESGQFYLAGIDKKLLTLVGNTSGNAVTLDGDAGLTFTTSGGSSTITGITSSSGNSTSLAASQSMVSAKQDKIIAGTNITIAQDGKTISATDTNELENLTDVNITTPTNGQGLVYNNTTQKWENGIVSSASSIDTLTDVNLTNLTNGQILKYDSTNQEWVNANESGGGGGSTVIPNPTGTPTDTLDTVSIDGTIYEIQGGGGGSSQIDALWEGSVAPSVNNPIAVNLTHDIDDYDYILVNIKTTDQTYPYHSTCIYKPPFSINDLLLNLADGNAHLYCYLKINSLTNINLQAYDSQWGAATTYTGIYGVKFGGGGGSGGVLKGLDYANAVTLTLPDKTGYDYTPTGYGVLMATSYGDAGSITITSQNEGTKYLTFRNDTWTTSWIPVTKDETYHVNRGSSSTDFPSGSWFKFIPWLCEGSGGGGSSITPNPTDPATDTLTSIEIDGTVYSVGGGDASAEEMTLSNYNALTTEEKNDGTIRFIPKSNIGYGLDIDFTNSTAYEESGMSHTVNNNEVQIIWPDASSAIGFTIYPTVKIDVTDYDFISYDLTSTSSYSATYGDNPLRDLGVGLKATAPSTMTLAPNMDYTVWNRYEVTDVGTTFTDERIDVSNLTGKYYLIIACAGWNAVVSNIVIGTEGGNPSQIKYMDKTYGIGSDGEGYTEEIIYSATPATAAPSTLTLTKPYTDFDMLLFNLYRSADGVMNKYDRVVLTSKLSLNDRIQLITYNEWASYDITTTTSFTLINENRMYIGSVVGLKFGEGGGSGGSSEVTYSTTEHKVGTWIDGSDVYEKTISISNVSLSSGSYETVDTITGLDTIISCNGYVVEGNLKYTLNDITLRVIQDGTSVKFYSPSGTTWTISSGAIIIRYTKVTSS